MSEQPPKVLVTRRFPPEIEALLEQDYRATLNETDRIHTPEELVAAAREHDAVMCCPSERFSREVLEQVAGSIGIVATFSVGFEHIDVPAARDVGVVVTNTPDVLTDATADTAMLCILAAARRGAEGDRFVRSGGWDRWHTMLMLGIHVTGKRLGILGMGRIGQALARRARGFDLAVHYHNRRQLSPEQEHGGTFHADPADLLAVSDFLSINCPSTPETVKFLNAERIEMLPAGAIVVNTARGNIVDDEAAHRRSSFGAPCGSRPRRVRQRAEPPSRLSRPRERVHAAARRERDPRDADGDGQHLPRQPRAFFAGRPCPQALT